MAHYVSATDFQYRGETLKEVIIQMKGRSFVIRTCKKKKKKTDNNNNMENMKHKPMKIKKRGRREERTEKRMTSTKMRTTRSRFIPSAC